MILKYPKIFWLFFAALLMTHAEGTKDEENLFRDLFGESYNTKTRPVRRNEESVIVTLDLELYQLIEINEKAEYIKITAWLKQRWKDHRLSWNISDYDGIEEINLDPSLIWKPDIVLYNSVHEDGGHMDTLKNRVVINYEGSVYWTTSIVFKTRCGINVEDFPFDTQHCFLKFGSWTHHMGKINAFGTTLNADFYNRNQEWNLVERYTTREECRYGKKAYAEVDFHLHFRRRSLFYVFNLILPIVLITLLTMLTFILPAGSGERLGVAVTLMLAVTVFMLLVAESIPESSDSVPFIGVFFLFCLATMFFIIVALAFVSRLYHRTKASSPMSKWTRKYIFNYLSYKVGARYAERDTQYDGRERSTLLKFEFSTAKNRLLTFFSRPLEKCIEKKKDHKVKNTIINVDAPNDEVFIDLSPMKEKSKDVATDGGPLNAADKDLYEGEVNEGRGCYTLEEEWCIVGKTVDHCLFAIFIVTFIVGCVRCFGHTTYVK